MKTGLWKIPAGLAALALAFALSGCPVSANDRDVRGVGDLFGGGPDARVTVTVTGIPYVPNGTEIEAMLGEDGDTRRARVTGGSFTVTWNAVPILESHTVGFYVPGWGWARTNPRQLDAGENIVPWSQFLP
ncbi:MAG: hypothetical protein FWB79_00695 [Treponema sp.]|nr:hypothetical protein [Treponema sp.]